MKTNKDVALKILQVGKAGFTTQEDGYKKLDECIALIDKYVAEQLILSGVGNSVFTVTENDNYGRPLYHDTFKTIEEAKMYIDGVNHLDSDRTFTNIVEKEFD